LYIYFEMRAANWLICLFPAPEFSTFVFLAASSQPDASCGSLADISCTVGERQEVEETSMLLQQHITRERLNNEVEYEGLVSEGVGQCMPFGHDWSPNSTQNTDGRSDNVRV